MLLNEIRLTRLEFNQFFVWLSNEFVVCYNQQSR